MVDVLLVHAFEAKPVISTQGVNYTDDRYLNKEDTMNSCRIHGSSYYRIYMSRNTCVDFITSSLSHCAMVPIVQIFDSDRDLKVILRQSSYAIILGRAKVCMRNMIKYAARLKGLRAYYENLYAFKVDSQINKTFL